MPAHSQPGNEYPTMLHYRFTVFLSAFLLFSVQLLLGKYLLPWFGGTPAMWTTCMLFFQTLLLAGYAYAHALTTWVRPPRAQVTVHSVVLVLSLLVQSALWRAWHSPIMPDASWKPHGSNHPIWTVITLLTVSVGAPYFVLSSTGPLLQAWFTRTHPRETPYRLYALSNLGSFLALLAYPFLVEPQLTLKTQARLWSWGFLGYALGCGYCAWRFVKIKTPMGASPSRGAIGGLEMGDGGEATPPGAGRYALWLSLAACASTMFLATTNQICQDIAVIPLLWVLPLSLYLLSFVICFEKPAWYSRGVFHPAFALAVFGACFVLFDGALGSIIVQVLIYCVALFACCMVCHGELARAKPNSRYLTSFYLMVAVGGATGGAFVALLAPHIFRGFWEYQFGLWGSAVLLFLILVRDKGSWLYLGQAGSPVLVVLCAALLPECIALATYGKKSLSDLAPFVAIVLAVYLMFRRKKPGFDRARARAAPVYCSASLVILGLVLFGSARAQVRNALVVTRNFYGMLGVLEQNTNEPDRWAYSLRHGRIVHGFQFRLEAKRGVPTGYYATTSGAGRALLDLQRTRGSANHGGLRIGVVGLGIGTLAAYAKPGDYVRFYEINPEVIRIAENASYFTYLRDCPAPVDVIPGDARLSMEDELRRNHPQQFDLLAMDAFSGDAIPLHLLTEEAFRVYLRHLRDSQAVLAVHITNSYLDLKPVLGTLANHLGLNYAWIHSSGDGQTASESDWVLLWRGAASLQSLSTSEVSSAGETRPPAARLWTDDYSNLFQVLKR